MTKIQMEGNIKDVKHVEKHADDGTEEYWNVKVEREVGKGRITIKTYNEPELSQGESVEATIRNNQARLTTEDEG